MNPIEEDIRSGQFKPVYLLYGEEEYLKEYYRNRLKHALIPEEDSMNLHVWRGKDTDLQQLKDQAMTLPFFAAHRLIIAEDTGLFKRGGDEVAAFLPELPEETILLFVEKETDARCRLYKETRKVGAILELKQQKEEALQNWILRRLTSSGKRIQRSAMALLLERTGNDMMVISNELGKLIDYTEGREDILLEDVQAVITVQAEAEVFELAALINSGQKAKALRQYEKLLSARESPVRILAVLSSQYARLLRIRELREQGMDVPSISEKLGMKSFAVRKNLGQSSGYTSRELEMILEEMIRADEMIKTGRIPDRDALELVIMGLLNRSSEADSNRNT